jgi:protein-ribulosamine 3-kinase
MPNWPDILKQIKQNTSLSADRHCIRQVSGGCINSSFLIGGEDLQIFVKINLREHLAMFEAEAIGLSSIANAEAILSPEVLCTGCSKEVAFIAMQAIDLQNTNSAASYRAFGLQLANMHRYQQPRFGANVDNTIGSTPQYNPWSKSWFEFWRKHRLGFQLDLACQNRAPRGLIDDGLRLNESFEALFDRQPKAACLHGDLWRGNWGFNEFGVAVIFDPAHYFGDREADIAMTALFGPAHADFYAVYQECYPLDDGYTVRATFYNLYHILNHFNLFGGAYASQAHNMVRSLLSELE